MLTGWEEDGLRQYARDPDGGIESGQAREPFGHESYRGAVVSTPLEGSLRLRPSYGSRSARSVSPALPTPGKSGKSTIMGNHVIIYLPFYY